MTAEIVAAVAAWLGFALGFAQLIGCEQGAETYPTEDELLTAVNSFTSWREVAGGGLQ
jgi:hypothetical protein